MLAQKDFEIDTVLNKPLMAHLATVDKGEPRDSLVWFIWEESCLWVFGTTEHSFIKRLQQEPQCAIGVVDFDLQKGVLKHVGIRGTAQIGKANNNVLSGFQNYLPILLKLSLNTSDLEREAKALNTFEGFGGVSVLNKNKNAILLEKALPGLITQ